MAKNFRERTAKVAESLRSYRADMPDVMQAFGALSQSATRGGVLDRKTKELIALCVGVAGHCDACIGFHMQTLVKLGQRAPRSRRRWPFPCTWAADRRSCTRRTRCPRSSS